MSVRLTTAERVKAFGRPGDPVVRQGVATPWGITVSCHHLVVDVFLAACQKAWERRGEWAPRRIDSYALRDVRGSADVSLHSWPLAWDFFATPPNVPPPGGVWTPENGVPDWFAACFEEAGFTWGARWARRDVPHIEWAGPPPTPRPQPPPPAPPVHHDPLPPLAPPRTYGDDMTLTAIPARTNEDPNGGWTVVDVPCDQVVSVMLIGSDYSYTGLFQKKPASDPGYDPATQTKITLAEQGNPGWADIEVWALVK